ncbi:MAG: GNAT family N-acetyltransferase [Planctomycetaceae bacterium]|nr:GNAT family N-acetyltransferase [Planctomycetaceae bacterium]
MNIPTTVNSLNDEPFAVVEQFSEVQIVQLHELVQQQWWGGKRTLEQVRIMAANSSLTIGLADAASGRLIGFCRALTDFIFRATIYDVMVDRAYQGQGLGGKLLDTLCNHPRMQEVSQIYLACEPRLFPFYERWGFKVYEARTEWMVKVQREEL